MFGRLRGGPRVVRRRVIEPIPPRCDSDRLCLFACLFLPGPIAEGDGGACGCRAWQFDAFAFGFGALVIIAMLASYGLIIKESFTCYSCKLASLD